MASILLEPVFPNLTKFSSGDNLRDLWKLFTKVKDCTQGGRRLENLYWRLWYQSSTTGGSIKEHNISYLLESWKEDGDSFMLKGSHSIPRKQIKKEEVKEQQVVNETVVESLGQGTCPTGEINTTHSTKSEPILPHSSVSTSSVIPPATPSIQISKVASNLKTLAANATNIPAIPAIPVVPAMPRTIHRKASKELHPTPSKVSVGFNSQNCSQLSAPLHKSPTTCTSTSKMSFSKETLAAKLKPTASSSQKLAEVTQTSKTSVTKKFYINDSDSLDSSDDGEEENRLAATTPTQDQDQEQAFPKVLPTQVVEHKPSNLASILRVPRRSQKMNLFGAGFASQNFWTRAAEDTSSQDCVSESLRKCLQLDRRPLADYRFDDYGSSADSFATTPSVW